MANRLTDYSGRMEHWRSRNLQAPRKQRQEVYVGLFGTPPLQEEVQYLLKDLNRLRVHEIQDRCKCLAFVELGSVQKVALAIQELNGRLFHKHKLTFSSLVVVLMQQVTSAETCVSDAVSEPAVFVLPADSAPEHAGAVLQCPGRPEEQQPHLRDPAVRRGTRCLAEYHLGDYGRGWNSHSQIEKPPRVPHELAQPGRCGSRPCRGWRWGAHLGGKTPRLKVLKGTSSWTRTWILSELVRRILQKLVHLYVRTHLNGAA
ncbi:Tudor Domain-Containing Protein 10 [Manis pentadactyla]|nr:Tudor Domain-Containing Protein 10 [Manis pentadactyla]